MKGSTTMMMMKTAAAGAALLVATQVGATTTSDTMLNSVTVTDACDVAAVGVNFGSINGLSTAATTFSANSDDKTFVDVTTPALGVGGLSTVVTAINAVKSVLTSTVSGVTGGGGVPGVYVLCTITPSKIQLSSPNTATTVNLLNGASNAATAAAFNGAFNSKMKSGVNSIDYSLHLVGVTSLSAAIVPTGLTTGILNAFAGVYLIVPGVAGAVAPNTALTIPASLPPAGTYTDTVTATVTF